MEIAVHPHNEAGLATAGAICERWNGERLPEFIGIEFNERTVPHHLHLVDLGPEADMPTWMTVDTDDLRHLPKHQGHPTRSIDPFKGPSDRLSPEFQEGWAGFMRWMASPGVLSPCF